jgi:ribosomal protein S6
MAEKKEHEDKEKTVVVYELGFHLVPSLGEDDLALRVTDIQKAIIAQGGSVLSEGQPQAFTLAYPMRKMRGGRWDHYETSFFGWVRFEAPTDGILGFKDFLDTNEHLVRYLLIKLDPIALMPEPVREPRREVSGEVEVEPKALVKKQDEEEKGEVSEEELDKQIEQLIH